VAGCSSVDSGFALELGSWVATRKRCVATEGFGQRARGNNSVGGFDVAFGPTTAVRRHVHPPWPQDRPPEGTAHQASVPIRTAWPGKACGLACRPARLPEDGEPKAGTNPASRTFGHSRLGVHRDRAL